MGNGLFELTGLSPQGIAEMWSYLPALFAAWAVMFLCILLGAWAARVRPAAPLSLAGIASCAYLAGFLFPLYYDSSYNWG
jgi:hypothetical protein